MTVPSSHFRGNLPAAACVLLLGTLTSAADPVARRMAAAGLTDPIASKGYFAPSPREMRISL